MKASTMRSSKLSKAFVVAYNIERFLGQESVNPDDFTPEELKLFEAYKKEHNKQRQQEDYKKRKATGKTPKPKKKRAEMDGEELEQVRAAGASDNAKTQAKKRKLREAAVALGFHVPRINDVNHTELRAMLSTRLSRLQIDEIEAQAIQEYEANPKERKAPDEDGRRKPGPAKKEAESKPAQQEPRSDYLRLFLELHPDHRRVLTTTQLTPEENRAYENWRHKWRKENEENYVEMKRAQYNRYDAEHREERAEAEKNRRQEDPDRKRQIEANYRSTDNGQLVTYFKSVQFNAKYTDVPCEINRELVASFREEPCYYCGDDLDKYGVDAVDISAGFVEGNVQPCCRVCNSAKKGHHYRDYLRMMCNIGMVHTTDTDAAWVLDYTFVDPSKDKGSGSFEAYKASVASRTKNIPFHLTKAQFMALTAQPCWYCRVEREGRRVGLDRVDSDGPYTVDNVVPSCAACNLLKSDFPQDVFLDKACKILKKWAAIITN